MSGRALNTFESLVERYIGVSRDAEDDFNTIVAQHFDESSRPIHALTPSECFIGKMWCKLA
jgi:hypothetical protein